MSKKVIFLTTASLWVAASCALAQENPASPTPAPSVDAVSPAAVPVPPAPAPVPSASAAAFVPPDAPPPAALPDAPPPPPRIRGTGAAGLSTPPRPPKMVKTPQEYVRNLQSVIRKTSDSDLNEENEDALGTGMLDEERDLDLDKAMSRYQAVIARFDRQRSEAAQATFHLGECYRKLGRMEEAKAQYGRVLREFADQAELVRASERYLFKATARSARAGASNANVNRTFTISKAPAGNAGGFGGGGGGGMTGRAGGVSGEWFLGGGEDGEEVEADVYSGKDGAKLTRRVRPNLGETPGEVGEITPEAARNHDLGEQRAEKMRQQFQLQQLKAGEVAVPGQKQGYGFSTAFGKSPVSGRSLAQQQDLMEAQTELDLARANLRGIQRQAKELQKKMQALAGAKPEHLPPPADADIRYANLLGVYTESLLRQPGDSQEDQVAAEKAKAAAYAKLQDYVAKVYRPTVQESLGFAQRQVEEARKEVEEARAKVEAMRGKLEQSLKEAGRREALEDAEKTPEEAKPVETPRK